MSAQNNGTSLSPWRQRWNDAGSLRTLTIEGRAWTVVDAGQGPPVLFVHGLGGSAFDWNRLLDPILAAGFRAIAPDLLGSGYSEKPTDADYTMAAHARRLAALLDALSIPRAPVVGSSFGGGVALCLAVAEPARVGRLALLSPAASPQVPPAHIRLMRRPFVGNVVFGVAPKRAVVERVLREAWASPDGPPADLAAEYAREHRMKGATRCLLRTARALADPASVALLARAAEIAAPVLVLWGDLDRITPAANLDDLLPRLPRASVRRYADLGHALHMEAPARVLDDLIPFLRA